VAGNGKSSRQQEFARRGQGTGLAMACARTFAAQLPTGREHVKKIISIAIALVVAAPLVASSAEVTGKVKSVEAKDNVFVLEDGTKLWVDSRHIVELQEGVKVRATYETKDGKNVVTELDRRVPGGEAGETTNFGTRQ
jgi:hypothetical protein